MFVPVLLLLGSAVLLWYLHWYVTYKRHLRKVPGPFPYPFVGNAPQIGLDTTAFFKSLSKFSNEHNGLVYLQLGPSAVLVITDPSAVRFVLTSNTILRKSIAYDFLENWLGRGLLTNFGESWHKRRKIITPAYHFCTLDHHLQVVNSTATKLIERLDNEEVFKSGGDIVKFIKCFSLDVISESSMGTSVNALENDDNEYFKAVCSMCRIIVERGLNPLLQYNFLYKFSKNYATEQRCLEVLHSKTMSIINRTRHEDLSDGKKSPFLDLLLKKSLTDDEIRDEVNTFLFAGHDTVSIAISFVLYNLSNHREIQENVFAEQIEIFQDDPTAEVDGKRVNEMKYLEAVIKESLRLYPSVPLYARHVTEEINLDTHGVTLPKNLALFIYAFEIHRNPEVFEDPEMFKPERFLGENANKYGYSYLPFSAGPRNCIGQKFAMMEMKCMLSKFLRHFKVHQVVPAHKVELCLETVLMPKNGVWLRLEKRI